MYIYRCVYRNIYIYIDIHCRWPGSPKRRSIWLRSPGGRGRPPNPVQQRRRQGAEAAVPARWGGRGCPPDPLQQRRRQGAETAVPARWGSQVSTQSIAAATTARSRISCAGEVGGPGVHPIRCSRNPHVSCLSHHHLHHRGCISCHLHGCYCIWHKFIHTHASRSKYKCC